jgi:hypothetical protein
LAERLPEHTSPELMYLETKCAALVSYGLTVKPAFYSFKNWVVDAEALLRRDKPALALHFSALDRATLGVSK